LFTCKSQEPRTACVKSRVKKQKQGKRQGKRLFYRKKEEMWKERMCELGGVGGGRSPDFWGLEVFVCVKAFPRTVLDTIRVKKQKQGKTSKT